MTDININVNLNLETLGLSFAAKNNTTSNRRDSIESKSAQKQTRKELTKRATSKASPSLTTLSSSSSKTKTPLINTAPYRPNPGRKDKDTTLAILLSRTGAGSFLVIPGGTWGYEGAYGLNNQYYWSRDGLEFPLNPAKINTAPSKDLGLFLYALLCDSFSEYRNFSEFNYNVLDSNSGYFVEETTTRRDNTPLYSESDRAFVGRVNLQDIFSKVNRLPYTSGSLTFPGSYISVRSRQYVSEARIALVTSKVRPPDITTRDWGPDPRVGAENTFLGFYTPFDQHKPNQNVLVQGRTFEFLCWMSNNEITGLVPARGLEDIQNYVQTERAAFCEVYGFWAGIHFRYYAGGPSWGYTSTTGPGLGQPILGYGGIPSQISLFTQGFDGQFLGVEQSGARDIMNTGQWNHVAIVASQGEARLYLNGQKKLSLAQPYRYFTSEEYDKNVANMGITTIKVYSYGYPDTAVINTFQSPTQSPINVDYKSGINYSQAIGPQKIKGIRYTERPLYYGDSFNPPSEILGFA